MVTSRMDFSFVFRSASFCKSKPTSMSLPPDSVTVRRVRKKRSSTLLYCYRMKWNCCRMPSTHVTEAVLDFLLFLYLLAELAAWRLKPLKFSCRYEGLQLPQDSALQLKHRWQSLTDVLYIITCQIFLESTLKRFNLAGDSLGSTA